MNTLYQCDEASKGGPTNDTDENKNKLYTYKLGDRWKGIGEKELIIML